MKRHIHRIGEGAAFEVEAAPDHSGIVIVTMRWPGNGRGIPRGYADYLLPLEAVRKLHRYLGDTLHDVAPTKKPGTAS